MYRSSAGQGRTSASKVVAIGVAVVVFGLLSGCAEMNRGAASPPKPRPMGAIDVHMHVVGTPSDKASDREKAFYLAPVEEKAQRLRQEMEKTGLAIVFLMGPVRSKVGLDDPLGVEENLRVAALAPGVKVVGAANPKGGLSEDFMAAVRRQLQEHRKDIVALKCYLGYQGGPEDPGYQPYYRLAEECNLPVIFHTGDTWPTTADVRLAHPLGVDRIATQHPKMRIVLAHVGVPWHLDAAEVAWKNNNVWLDLSGLLLADDQSVGRMLKARSLPDVVPGLVLRDLRDALGYMNRYERLLYGTDGPVINCSMANYRRFIEAVIPEEHHRKVFRDNAEKLFNVKAGQTGE